MKQRFLYILIGLILSIHGNAASFSISVTNGIYDGTSQIFLVSTNVSTNGACPLTNIAYSFIGTTSSGSAYNSPVAPTDAGSYQVTATAYFTCTTITSGPFAFSIAKATPTLTVTNSPLTYNTNTQSATLSFTVPGTLSNIQYNASTSLPINAGTYSVTANFVPNDAGNYNSLTGDYAGNFIINKANPTISITNSPVSYNGIAKVVELTSSVPGIFANNLYNGNSYIPGPVNAGTYSLSTNFTPDDQTNYNSLTNYNAGIFIINKSLLTITASSSLTKTYGINLPNSTVSTTDFSVSGGFESVGSVTLSFTPGAINLNDPAGSTSIVTPSNPLPASGGTFNSNNYDINFVDGVLTVTPKQLTITDPAITKTKEYDKTLTVNTTAGTLSGVVTVGSDTDVVTASAVGTYSTSTVGTAKTITVVYTLDGADKDNYIKPVDKVYTDGVITPKQLTITDPAITKTKEYDKTLTVNTTAGTLSGVVTVGSDTDVVTASAVGTYSTSTVGTAKTITVVYTLDGADKDNYVKPVDKVYTDGVITPKQLTIADPTITKTKEYDKTLTANTTAGTLSGVVTVGSVTDVVTASAVGTYSTSTVGTAKTITVVYTLDGADKDNYIKPVDKVYTDGVITPKQLTITDPVITKTKEYDKTLTANTTAGTLSGVVTVGSDTDVVTASAVGTYSTSTVGTAKTITVVYTLDGADKDNYIKPVDKVYTDGEITKKSIVVKAVASDKAYDGNKNATVILSSADIFSSDNVTISKTLAEFDTKDPGTNKTVTVSGISIDGLDAFNYNLTNTTATAIANITGSNTSSIRPFVLPNAFTPNGDTKNNEFKIIVNDPSRVTLILFQIYNRNGRLMFSTNDITKGWDGRYNGIIQDMGVYFVKYKIEVSGETPSIGTLPIYLLK